MPVKMKRAEFTTKAPTGLVKTVFELGLGPCGRVVTELELDVGSVWVTVTQMSFPPGLEDRHGHVEIKEFIYLAGDVVGWIVATQKAGGE